MIIQYVEDIEAALAAGCQVPGCDHAHGPLKETHLHQSCHAGTGLAVRYRRDSGILELTCRICSRPVANFALAEKP